MTLNIKYNMVLREVVKITGPAVFRMCETTSWREAEGSSLTGPTPKELVIFTIFPNKPCCICFTIPHKYFTS